MLWFLLCLPFLIELIIAIVIIGIVTGLTSYINDITPYVILLLIAFIIKVFIEFYMLNIKQDKLKQSYHLFADKSSREINERFILFLVAENMLQCIYCIIALYRIYYYNTYECYITNTLLVLYLGINMIFNTIYEFDALYGENINESNNSKKRLLLRRTIIIAICLIPNPIITCVSIIISLFITSL